MTTHLKSFILVGLSLLAWSAYAMPQFCQSELDSSLRDFAKLTLQWEIARHSQPDRFRIIDPLYQSTRQEIERGLPPLELEKLHQRVQAEIADLQNTQTTRAKRAQVEETQSRRQEKVALSFDWALLKTIDRGDVDWQTTQVVLPEAEPKTFYWTDVFSEVSRNLGRTVTGRQQKFIREKPWITGHTGQIPKLTPEEDSFFFESQTSWGSGIERRNLKTGALIGRSLRLSEGYLEDFVFSADARFVYSIDNQSSKNQSVFKKWSTSGSVFGAIQSYFTQPELFTEPTPLSPAAVALSSDDRLYYTVASNVGGYSIRCWDLEQKILVREFLLPKENGVTTFATYAENHDKVILSVSPDGRYLLISDKRNGILIVDIRGERLEQMIPTKGLVLAFLFSKDGKTLVAPTNRGDLLVFDRPGSELER